LIINLKRGDKPATILKGWLSQSTKGLIDDIVDEHQEDLGKPTRVFITDTARWGYCRRNGEIIFNWQLSCLPPELAEFVVIHELIHLQVLNHQSQFHAKMLNLIPDYQNRDSELKKYISIAPNFEYNI
ncbi:M48 family metallopeptidase, partial [Candidatus Bathyarchaeota archaeon]|nr:M48 family metallopeptidase [Candidatus Bathyarchaeota archaeon]